MAALHDSLKTLSPTTFSDLPTPATLPGYITNALRDTHILINSLPPLSSDTPADPLQKEWKPVKLNAKDNPHNFSVYKLASKDGKGAWFARRSVHSQLGFRRFRAGLAREFELGSERGSSIRGVGRERQFEKERCVLGQAEVNYLTAQFPGPSAPRDFVILNLTSSAHPEDLSPHADDAPAAPAPHDGAPKPRQFTMISRPLTDHPKCEERQGYVRAQYESVEFIREIPSVCAPPAQLHRIRHSEELRRVQSVPSVATLLEEEEGEGEHRVRRRGRTITFADSESVPEGLQKPGVDEGPHPEQNPVEWIMITRSDPGGSVPRWMVERGTPGGIVKDADKFLEWAAAKMDLEDDYPEDQESEEMAEGSKVGGTSGDGGEQQVHGQELHDVSKREPTHPLERSHSDQGPVEQSQSGLLSSAASAVSTGISMLTPSAISTSTTPSEQGPGTPTASTVTHNDLPTPPITTPSHSDDDDAASIATFATAPSPEDATSISSSTMPAPATPEDKALARLLREKAKLSEKLERQRSRERKKRSKDEEREQKLLEKHMKEVEKREARYQKDVEKARKREEKSRSKEMKEVIELKSVVEGLTKENLALRERVGVLETRERERERERKRHEREAVEME